MLELKLISCKGKLLLFPYCVLFSFYNEKQQQLYQRNWDYNNFGSCQILIKKGLTNKIFSSCNKVIGSSENWKFREPRRPGPWKFLLWTWCYFFMKILVHVVICFLDLFLKQFPVSNQISGLCPFCPSVAVT